MTQTAKEKIQRFVNDKVMSDAVYNVLQESLLAEGVGKDIHILAASQLAVQALKKSWKELEKYAKADKEPEKGSRQIGL